MYMGNGDVVWKITDIEKSIKQALAQSAVKVGYTGVVFQTA